jgi:hypothetical protein
MTVNALINMAVNGELKNLAIKDDTEAILGYLNLGLIELYKRFPLNVKEYVIELQDGVEIYTMPSDYMWVVAAYDEVPEGSSDIVAEIAINEEDNPASLNTVSWNQVQIPVTVTGAYVSVIYVAAPATLTTDDLEGDLPVPPQLIEALLHYVGYRGHGSVDGNIQGENNTHYQRFEISCDRVVKEGMYTSDDMQTKDKFLANGWV